MTRRVFALVLCTAFLSALSATATPDSLAAANDVNHWHISTYYAANLNGNGPGNRAMWCGDSTLVACGLPDSVGGFGNGWFDELVWSQPVPDPASPVTVRLTGWMNYDFPDETWDWIFPIVVRGNTADDLAEYTGGGVDNLFFEFTTVVTPDEFGGADKDHVQLRFRVTSDGAWSDADCFGPSRGAAQIDDITVRFDGEVVTFDDFEEGSPVNWVPIDPVTVSAPPDLRFTASAAPNPFNPGTRISYEIARAGRLSIHIHDERGRQVRRLVDERRAAGPGAITWDGRDDSGDAVASGLYFYRVAVGNEAYVGKLTLVK